MPWDLIPYNSRPRAQVLLIKLPPHLPANPPSHGFASLLLFPLQQTLPPPPPIPPPLLLPSPTILMPMAPGSGFTPLHPLTPHKLPSFRTPMAPLLSNPLPTALSALTTPPPDNRLKSSLPMPQLMITLATPSPSLAIPSLLVLT